jgi:hypothetical protein
VKLDDVILHWSNTWRSLAAWGAPIPMRVELKPYKGQQFVGLAWSCQGRALVRVTGDLAFDLGTALHELAHLAAPNAEHHGDRWREMFVAGVAEACGVDADEFEIDVTITDLNRQVHDAVAGWLMRSGQATVLRAIGVMS